MRQFPLRVGGAILQFDTDGRVLDPAANVVGDWTTTEDNRILLRRAGGLGSEQIEVEWAFDADNRLVISQGGLPVFTLAESVDGLPGFRLQKNVLGIDPDGDSDFEFGLRALYGLDAEGNLVVSVNGRESVVDGFLEDSRSRFRFQFREKPGGLKTQALVFSGQWQRRDEAAEEIRLHFALDDPALEIADKPLDLPAAVRVDPKRNNLALVYQSRTFGERRLQFLGSLEVKPDFTLVFRIDDVKEAGLRKSSIMVQSSFDWDAATGTLQLYVGKTRTPTSQVIEVGGALQARLKNGQLDWSFNYAKSTAGGKSMVTIATALRFEFEDGHVFVAYQQQGKSRRVDVTAKLVKEDFTVSGGISIANDPQGRSVKAFIGVAW